VAQTTDVGDGHRIEKTTFSIVAYWAVFIELLPGKALITSVTIYGMTQEEKSIFWEVRVSVIISKNYICTCVLFRTVPEI
jgi:hypothetical protein